MFEDGPKYERSCLQLALRREEVATAAGLNLITLS
jgi:hypothetical protein